MIVIISSAHFNALQNTLPAGYDIGWEEEGIYYHDSAMIPYLPFDINVTTQTAIGMSYSAFLAASTPREQFYPKIYRYIDNKNGTYDEREVPTGHDYKAGLSIRLQPKRTTVKGEVVRVDYYVDKELTDKVLTVEVSYERDPLGFATGRTTTRRWVMENGDYHPNSKVTHKSYTINMEDQIREGIRRRQNIVNTVQPAVLGAMVSLLSGDYSRMEILFLGRVFLDKFEIEFDKFIKASSTVTDPNDPNFGRKSVVVAFEVEAKLPASAWMNMPTPLLGGATILQYLSNEFSI